MRSAHQALGVEAPILRGEAAYRKLKSSEGFEPFSAKSPVGFWKFYASPRIESRPLHFAVAPLMLQRL